MARARPPAARHVGGRARPDHGADPGQPRPAGELVWFHAITQSHADVALRLADRLTAGRPGLHLLLTADADALPPEPPTSNVILGALPDDAGATAQAFLGHWRPDVCIWSGGNLRPVVLGAAHGRGIPLLLVDAEETRLSRPVWRWLPDSTRQTLKRFSMIMARDASTESLLRRRFRMHNARIMVTGTLREESKPLPYNEDDHQELSAILRRRLVWLAARLRPEEIDIVLQANRQVIRLSHRMLLIVAPDDPENAGPFHEALEREGLRYVTWSEGTLPDETTQVILADTPGEMGLWYRIAPICFLGGSLCDGAHGSDPSEPAAHGAAILYGPNIRTYLSAYSRFAEAGAARIVRDADTLAEAVQRITPPDRSAAMAHAAWDVATQGAAVMDELVETVGEVLDTRAAC